MKHSRTVKQGFALAAAALNKRQTGAIVRDQGETRGREVGASVTKEARGEAMRSDVLGVAKTAG